MLWSVINLMVVFHCTKIYDDKTREQDDKAAMRIHRMMYIKTTCQAAPVNIDQIH